jgi:hypothetical protein
MGTETTYQATPIWWSLHLRRQMSNIAPSQAFAFHDKGFRPDHFFWRTEFHWKPKTTRRRMF